MEAVNYDEETSPAVSDAALKEIAALAARQSQIEEQIAAVEVNLRGLNDQLRKVSEKDLPEAMATAGCKSYTLLNGQVVTIKEGLTASVSAARKPEVCAWLRANGFGDLVSEDVAVSFGRGEEGKAEAAAQLLLESGLFPVCKTDINTARLKALITEQLAAGKDMPLELLGAYVWKKSVVK